MLLSVRYSDALRVMMELHAGQERKASGVPFVAHLLEVSSLVLLDGGSEDEAIAGLLHDAVEDAGGERTADLIRDRFGHEVLRIVLACSDDIPGPDGVKRPWRERKEAYIAHLEDADESILRVAAADKVANVRSLLADHDREGESVWARFNAPKTDQLWVYGAYRDAILEAGFTGALARELDGLTESLLGL